MAAGIFAALSCAEEDPEAQIIVFEKSRHFLTKVRISGGGRCNVTHNCFEPKELIKNYPRGSKELLGAFYAWQPEDTINWYQDRGVELKTEADGRMFPTTDDSQTIIDCLLSNIAEANIFLKPKTGINSIQQSEDKAFRLETSQGEQFDATHVVIATGGGQTAGHTLAQSLGHTITDLAPSLFTFNIDNPLLKGLSGVSVPNARVHCPSIKQSQEGPALITHWGLSGPAILKLSAWGARQLAKTDYRFEVSINWIKELSLDTARSQLAKSKTNDPKKQISTHCPFELPRRLWKNLVEHSGVNFDTQWAQLSKSDLEKIALNLTACILSVDGKSTNKEEFVTCGGVSLKEINFKDMQSKQVQNLFFAGEALDIDGVTGGFNFQAAWTTGRIAGLSIAHS